MKDKIEFTRKIQKIGDSICVTIPKKIANKKGWKVKDLVKVTLNDNGHVLIKDWHKNPTIRDFT